MDGDSIGVSIFPDGPARSVPSAARLCEKLGFGFFGVGDVQDLWADVYVALTLAADAATRIRIGPWVTNPLTRHPTVTANAIATLNEISEGRAFLGIGAGDGALRTSGKSIAGLGELADAVRQIRECLDRRRGPVDHSTVPVLWAASGPRSIREGGRHADGVIVAGWNVPDMLHEAQRLIDEGIDERESAHAPVVTRIFHTGLAVDEDRGRAIDIAKPYVARALARSSSAKVPGWSKGHVERFRRDYDYRNHFRPDQALAKLVPDELVDRKAIAGTPQECAVLLQRVFDARFDRIALYPIGETDTMLRRLAHEVLPLVHRHTSSEGLNAPIR